MIPILCFMLLCYDSPEGYEGSVEPKTEYSTYSAYSNPIKAVILKSVKIYQGTVSKVQGDVCNFIPSCSHYGYEAIRRYDFIKGILMASDRIQRCHGFAPIYVGRPYGIAEDSIRGVKAFDPVR